MNWGWKIFLLYSVFAIMVLAMVAFAMTQDVFLVEKDYYKQEIEYQDQIDKIKNTAALNDSIKFEYQKEQGSILLDFPSEVLNGISGKIHFFRPSDAGHDKFISINVGQDGRQVVAVNEMPSGLWQIRIQWTTEGIEYYYEQKFIK